MNGVLRDMTTYLRWSTMVVWDYAEEGHLGRRDGAWPMAMVSEAPVLPRLCSGMVVGASHGTFAGNSKKGPACSQPETSSGPSPGWA
jgi:hypothetical protein